MAELVTHYSVNSLKLPHVSVSVCLEHSHQPFLWVTVCGSVALIPLSSAPSIRSVSLPDSVTDAAAPL